MSTATLTSKGQVTVPKPIREQLRLKTGDRLDFVLESDGRVVIEPAGSDIRSLRGLLRRPDRPAVSVREMDAGIARHLAAEHRKTGAK